MKNIFIEKSFRGPAINFDRDNGLIEIKGHSILENPKNFYLPLIDNWLENYITNPAESTLVNIELEYFNSSSAMWIFQILKKLKSLHDMNRKVQINWHYYDEDMLEVGEDYQSVLSIPIKMVQTEYPENSTQVDF